MTSAFFTIKTDGKVGIGTATPSAELDINGADSASSGGLEIMHTNGSQGISFGFKGISKTGTNSESDLTLDGKATGDVLLNSIATGNVGIGVATPTSKLHVDGDVRITEALRDSNGDAGVANQILSTTSTGIDWIDAPNGIETWVNTKAYKLRDLVINNNKLYQANADIVIGAAFSIGTAGWKEISAAGITIFAQANDYAANALVVNNDKIYQANTAIPSTTAFVIGSAGETWKEISPTAVTTWVSSGAYVVNNLVAYNGIIYKCIKAHNSVTTAPNVDATNWLNTDSWLGYKTIHHVDPLVALSITHTDHNNSDIHIENIAELTITDTNVSDGTNFYITNTTGADRSITFLGFTGAFLRNGGAEVNVQGTGLTLKSNTRYLCHVTKNGSDSYFNATEAGAEAAVPYEVYNGKPIKETLTNLVAAGILGANFTMALVDGDVNAVATTSSSSSTSGLVNAFKENDIHTTNNQLTETITITFDRLFVLTKLRGNGKNNTDYYKDLELQLYDENDDLISTTTTNVKTGDEYFEFRNNKKIKKLILIGSDRIGGNTGINNIEFFTAEKQLDYAVIPSVPGIVTEGDIIRFDAETGHNRVTVSDPTISEIIIPNFEAFDSTRFDLINATANSSAGESETLFDEEYNAGLDAFQATSTTTTDNYGFRYRLKGYYNIKEFRIQASSNFLRSGGGTVRVYNNGVWVYGSSVITAASAVEGWVSVLVLPALPGIKGNEVQFLFENGAVNNANDRVVHISEFQVLGAYPETLSVNGGLSVNGDLVVGSKLIFTDIANNRVGINHANPARTLQVGGSIGYTGTSSNASDRRLKESITPLESSLAKLLSVRGVNFYWKDKAISEDLQIGVIAQEIEPIFPELVLEGYEYKSVNYVGLIPILLEAIKEQQAQLEAKEAAINTLKARLERIEEILELD